MVPRGGVEPPTLRFSEAERIWPIKGLAFGKLEKRAGFGLWMANAYRFGMGRITRYPSKSNTKYLHEVRVGTYTVDQAWLWEEVERVAGHAGYKKRSRFWACTIIAFGMLMGLGGSLISVGRHLRRMGGKADRRAA